MLMAAFYRPTAKRSAILIEAAAFPSDRYATASQIMQRGFDPNDLHKELKVLNDKNPILGTHELNERDVMHSKALMKVLNNFSDETAGVPILESCLMKAKQHSYITIDMDEKMKGKGCPGSVLKAAATHQHYRSCILGTSTENLLQKVSLQSLDSHTHQVYTQNKERIMLSNVDNKRFAIDTVHSLPYGFDEAWIPALDQSASALEAFLSVTD